MDLESVARRLIADGSGLDAVAAELLATGCGPIAAIKALRSASDIHLGEAKSIVHRSLPAAEQAAAERLWDAAISTLEQDDESAP